jgi:hypothetical protein
MDEGEELADLPKQRFLLWLAGQSPISGTNRKFAVLKMKICADDLCR